MDNSLEAQFDLKPNLDSEKPANLSSPSPAFIESPEVLKAQKALEQLI